MSLSERKAEAGFFKGNNLSKMEYNGKQFIDDPIVLFKDFTMLECKTMFYSLPTGPSGGGNLPTGYVSLKEAIKLHRHYTSLKLSNAPKRTTP